MTFYSMAICQEDYNGIYKSVISPKKVESIKSTLSIHYNEKVRTLVTYSELNEHGKMMINRIDEGGEGEKYTQTECNFDSLGNILKTEKFDIKDGVSKLNFSMDFYYNEKGLIDSLNYFSSSLFSFSKQIKFYYDPQNNLTKEKIFYTDEYFRTSNNIGEIIVDYNKNIKTITHYNYFGDFIKSEKSEIELDIQYTKEEHGNEFEIDSYKIILEFDDYGNWVKMTSISIDNNLSKSITTREIVYRE